MDDHEEMEEAAAQAVNNYISSKTAQVKRKGDKFVINN